MLHFPRLQVFNKTNYRQDLRVLILHTSEYLHVYSFRGKKHRSTNKLQRFTYSTQSSWADAACGLGSFADLLGVQVHNTVTRRPGPAGGLRRQQLGEALTQRVSSKYNVTVMFPKRATQRGRRGKVTHSLVLLEAVL